MGTFLSLPKKDKAFFAKNKAIIYRGSNPQKEVKGKVGALNDEDSCSTEDLTTCCSLYLFNKSQKFLLNILGI